MPALLLSSGSPGVRPISWIAVGALYIGLVVAVAHVELTPAPVEPWPDREATFELVFAPPPSPQAAAPSSPPQSAGMPDPAPAPSAALEAPPVAPEAAVDGAPPEPAPTAEPAATVPPQPPRKPAPPRAATPVRANSAPAPVAPASPPTVGAGQVATLPPAEIPLVPPRPISAAEGNAKPAYPAEALRHRLQGRVVLHVEVSAAGEPLAVTVRVSSGSGLLDQAALHAVETWRFIPATRGGTAVAGGVDVPVQFRLED